MIKLKDVTKIFNKNKAVDEVSLELNVGEVVALVGPSGAGKSTLASLIVNENILTSGRVEIFGKNMLEYTAKDLAEKVQKVFQNPTSSLNPHMNVFDILSEPLNIRDEFLSKEDAYGLLNIFKLDNLFMHPRELSIGDNQKIAILRALSLKPKFLICDEITSALDLKASLDIVNFLLKEKRNMGILFISHDLKLVKKICDRVAYMENGKLDVYTKEDFFEKIESKKRNQINQERHY